jgi:hypothetical protein
MFFTGATAPGTPETPNEDWIGATSDLAVLLDGATSRTETGCRHGAAWYTRKLGATIIAEAASRSLSLGDVLANAIREVARLHPECDLTHPGTPSAAAAIVRVEDDQLRYLVLGDVTIFLEFNHGIRIISDHRVSQTATFERAEADRHLIGSEGKARALIAMKHAELAAKNRGEGYWIAAAQPGVVRHAIHGSEPLREIRRMAILSDGATRVVELFGLFDWPKVMHLLSSLCPRELISQVRLAEERDPLGEAHPRNKKSDDATVLFLELTQKAGQS